MNEIWKDIEGYNGLYQVSNLGRVKSLGRRGKGCSLEDRILKPMINKDGYHLVNLKDVNHVAKWFTIHRLVALHFIPNPNDYKEINHKDEAKGNNSVTNLEWCTREYNVSYGTVIERQSNNKKGQSNEWLNKPILQYSIEGEFIAEFDSTTQAAQFLAPVLGKDMEKIKKAINNQLRKYPNGKSCGFNWRYKL
jgi:hypothetical protein